MSLSGDESNQFLPDRCWRNDADDLTGDRRVLRWVAGQVTLRLPERPSILELDRTTGFGLYSFPESGSTLSGINFAVTIYKMRAPGMDLMKMPLFVWTTICTAILDDLRSAATKPGNIDVGRGPVFRLSLFHQRPWWKHDELRQPVLAVWSIRKFIF